MIWSALVKKLVWLLLFFGWIVLIYSVFSFFVGLFYAFSLCSYLLIFNWYMSGFSGVSFMYTFLCLIPCSFGSWAIGCVSNTTQRLSPKWIDMLQEFKVLFCVGDLCFPLNVYWVWCLLSLHLYSGSWIVFLPSAYVSLMNMVCCCISCVQLVKKPFYVNSHYPFYSNWTNLVPIFNNLRFSNITIFFPFLLTYKPWNRLLVKYGPYVCVPDYNFFFDVYYYLLWRLFCIIHFVVSFFYNPA